MLVSEITWKIIGNYWLKLKFTRTSRSQEKLFHQFYGHFCCLFKKLYFWSNLLKWYTKIFWFSYFAIFEIRFNPEKRLVSSLLYVWPRVNQILVYLWLLCSKKQRIKIFRLKLFIDPYNISFFVGAEKYVSEYNFTDTGYIFQIHWRKLIFKENKTTVGPIPHMY